MAAEDGPEIVTRPSVPGSRSEVRDVEPLAGFRAAHELEAGARYIARSYVRDAREGGATWHDIGLAMDPHLREDARHAGPPPAELAYQYATERDGQDRPFYDTAFSWKCSACDKLVIDRGPYNSPAASQPGHASDCARLAQAEADWDAGWEATS